MGRLYLSAQEIGEVHCKGMIERYMLEMRLQFSISKIIRKGRVKWTREDISILLKMYALSFGRFQETLKEFLFAIACARFTDDPSSATALVEEMRKINPVSFHKINISTVYARIHIPLVNYFQISYEDRIVSPDIPFIHMLKTLAPEIRGLEFDYCQFEESCFQELTSAYENLNALQLNNYHTPCPSSFTLFKNLKLLKIVAPNWELLNAASQLSLRSLELSDFSHSDELIDRLFKESPDPKFCETLHTLTLSGCPFNKLSGKKAAMLLSRLPKLKELHLHIRISHKFLHVVKENCKGLTAATIPSLISWPHSPFPEKEVQSFVEHFTTITHFSYEEVNKQENDDLFHAVNALPILKSLEFHHMSDHNLRDLVEKHPELEILNISHTGITAESLPELVKLTRLHTLNLAGTNLSMRDILDISSKLPKLKSLTIHLQQPEGNLPEIHSQIADILSYQGIDVIIAQRN